MRLILALIASLFAHGEQKPPQTYIDKGACPFECCVYRDWKAKSAVTLVEEPDSSKLVGTVKKGETVKALTGEVHITPVLMQVVYGHENFKKGDRVYLLTSEGEGFRKVWFKGKLFRTKVSFAMDEANEDKYCAKPSAYCWGRILDDIKSVWWVKIRLKDGKKGWTSESAEFDNKDGCA